MTPQELQQVRQLFVGALEQPPEARASWLLRQEVPEAVRAQVQKQLALLDALPNELERPADPSLPDAPPPSVLQRIEARGDHVSPVLLDDGGDDSHPLVTAAGTGEAGPKGTIDHYQILGEIARGGVGIVLKGHDTDLGRLVALKVLHEEHARRPEMIQRFVEEAQIGGQLQHPGIVPVYELGLQADQRPFFAMKLVKGRTLGKRLAERDGPAQDRPRLIAIFAQVCQTIAYAHARGVLHRDLKPSNVMIGSYGEVQVVDWGMAKVIGRKAERSRQSADDPSIATVRSKAQKGSGSGSSHSRTGSVMGTPAYMAPEQARGEVETLDQRADVFSLGALLCEILTGGPPYVGESSDAVLAKSFAADLDDARQRLARCGADRELLALARDCLAVERNDRPRDAGVVSERVTAWIDGTAERARQADVRAVAARRTQKLWAVVAAVVLVGIAATSWFWRDSELRRQDLAASNERLSALAYAAGMHRAGEAIDAGRHEEAIERLEALDEARRGWAWRWLRQRARSLQPALSPLDLDNARVVGWDWNPTSRLAASCWVDASVSEGARLCVLELPASGKDPCSTLWTLPSRARHVRFDPSGEQLLLLESDGRLVLHDARSGRALTKDAVGIPTDAVRFAQQTPGAIAFAPDGGLVVGGGDGSLYRFEREGSELRPLERFADFDNEGVLISFACFGPRGDRLLVGDEQGKARLVDARSGEQLWSFAMIGYLNQRLVTNAAFDPDGTRLLLTGGGGHVYVLDAATGQLQHELEPHHQTNVDQYYGYSVGFSRDGRLALTGGVDGARLYDAVSWRTLARLVGAAGVWFDAREDVVVGLAGRGLTVWDVGALLGSVSTGRGLGLQGCAIAADGAHVLSATPQNGLRVVDARTGAQEMARIGRDPAMLQSVAPSPDGAQLAIGRLDQSIVILDAADGSELRRIEPDADTFVPAPPGRPAVGIRALAFGPASAPRLLAAGIGTIAADRDHDLATPVLLYDTDSGRLLQTLTGLKSTVWAIAFRDDGERVVAAGPWGGVAIWNPSTGERLWLWQSPRTPICWSVAIHPETGEVLAGDNLGVVTALDPERGTERWHFSAHSADVMGIEFLDGGRRFCTVCTTGSMRVWDTRTRDELLAITLDRSIGRPFGLKANAATDRIAVAVSDHGAAVVLDTAPAANWSVQARNAAAVRLVDALLDECRDLDVVKTRIPERAAGDRDLERVAFAVLDGLTGEPLTMIERRVRQRFAAGDFAAAIETCRRLELEPDRGPLRVARQLYEPYGRDDEATRALEQVVAAEPGNSVAHALLARQHAYRFETDPSREHVDLALRGAPDGTTLAICAIALSRLGDLDAAIALMERFPEDDYLRRVNIGAFRLDHRAPGAAQSLRSAMEAIPNQSLPMANLTELALLEGDLEGALLLSQQAIDVEARNPRMPEWTRSMRARALLANDRLAEALPEFDLAFSTWRRPTGSGSVVAYADALARSGDVGRARAVLAELTVRYPLEPFSWQQRAWWLATADADGITDADRREAVEHARRGVELSHQRSPMLLATLAEALFATGDAPGAIPAAECARELMNGSDVEFLSRDELDARLARYRR